jgi:hypothetical protein
MLPGLGAQLAGQKDAALMLKLAEYDLHWFPQSGMAYLMLAQAHAMGGQKDAVQEDLRKAVELNPDLKEQADRLLSRLQKK